MQPRKNLNDAIITANDLKTMPMQDRKMFLNPWLKENQIVLMVGPRGVGKTWSALSALKEVSQGGKFGPWECGEPIPVLFLDGEMSLNDLQERIKEIQSNSQFYIYSCAYANEIGLPRAHLINKRWRDEMKMVLSERNIKLWAIDILASLASGIDENAKRDPGVDS